MIYPAMAGNDDDRSATGSEPCVFDVAPTKGQPRGIYVGTPGTVVGRLQDDTADSTWKNASGTLPHAFKIIRAAGTTAADINYLY